MEIIKDAEKLIKQNNPLKRGGNNMKRKYTRRCHYRKAHYRKVNGKRVHVKRCRVSGYVKGFKGDKVGVGHGRDMKSYNHSQKHERRARGIRRR